MREGTLSQRPYRGDEKKGGDPVTQRPYRGDGKKGGDPVTETVQR